MRLGNGKLLEDGSYETRDLEHHHELVVFPHAKPKAGVLGSGRW